MISLTTVTYWIDIIDDVIALISIMIQFPSVAYWIDYTIAVSVNDDMFCRKQPTEHILYVCRQYD